MFSRGLDICSLKKTNKAALKRVKQLFFLTIKNKKGKVVFVMPRQFQFNLYDFLPNRFDPVYNAIFSLNHDKQSIVIDDYSIYINSIGLYEVASEKEHEAFRTAHECYCFMSDRINELI